MQFIKFVRSFRFSKFVHAAHPQHVYCPVQVKLEVTEDDVDRLGHKVTTEVNDEQVDHAMVTLEAKDEERGVDILNIL